MNDPFGEDTEESVDDILKAAPSVLERFDQRNAEKKNRKSLSQRFQSWRQGKAEKKRADFQRRREQFSKNFPAPKPPPRNPSGRPTRPPPPPTPPSSRMVGGSLAKTLRAIKDGQVNHRDRTIYIDGERVPVEQIQDYEDIVDQAMEQLDQQMESMESHFDRTMSNLDDQMEGLDERLNSMFSTLDKDVEMYHNGQKLFKRKPSKETQKSRAIMKAYNNKRKGTDDPGP